MILSALTPVAQALGPVQQDHLLEAAAGRELLERCYRAARAEGYVGHEFGDLNLILP